MKSSTDPDYVYSPEDWVFWDERDDLMDDVKSCEVREFATLIEGPKKWAVLPLGGWHAEWFDTKEDAEAFAASEKAKMDEE